MSIARVARTGLGVGLVLLAGTTGCRKETKPKEKPAERKAVEPAAEPKVDDTQQPEGSVGDSGNVGKVVFPTACDQKVQAQFERGVALLHAFFYGEARKNFTAVVKALKLLGIRRSLHKIGWTFKNGNNYIGATVKELGPTALEIQLGPLVGPAGYYEGIRETGPRLLGAKTATVKEVAREGEHVTWHVAWTE